MLCMERDYGIHNARAALLIKTLTMVLELYLCIGLESTPLVLICIATESEVCRVGRTLHSVSTYLYVLDARPYSLVGRFPLVRSY